MSRDPKWAQVYFENSWVHSAGERSEWSVIVSPHHDSRMLGVQAFAAWEKRTNQSAGVANFKLQWAALVHFSSTVPGCPLIAHGARFGFNLFWPLVGRNPGHGPSRPSTQEIRLSWQANTTRRRLVSGLFRLSFGISTTRWRRTIPCPFPTFGMTCCPTGFCV
jgi:hypothetical protein